MILSKSLRIALIAAVGCLGLSIPPTSQAENLTNEEIAEQLGFERYDTRFMERSIWNGAHKPLHGFWHGCLLQTI